MCSVIPAPDTSTTDKNSHYIDSAGWKERLIGYRRAA